MADLGCGLGCTPAMSVTHNTAEAAFAGYGAIGLYEL